MVPKTSIVLATTLLSLLISPIVSIVSDQDCPHLLYNDVSGGKLDFPMAGSNSHIQCMWFIGVQQPNMVLQLEFDWTTAEGVSSDHGLALLLPNMTLLHNFTAASPDPKSIIVPHPGILLNYIGYRGKGFTLIYSAAASLKTSMDVKTAQGGLIKFPSFGGYSEANRVEWSIKASNPNDGITLKFNGQDLRCSPASSHDSLTIWTVTGALLDRVCGTSSTPTLLNYATNEIVLLYMGDSIVAGSSFELEYSFIPSAALASLPTRAPVEFASTPNSAEMSTEDATRKVTMNYGTTEAAARCQASQLADTNGGGSFQYPVKGLYTFNTVCSWNITVSPSAPGMLLSFGWMDIGIDQTACEGDALKLSLPNGTSLWSLCGLGDKTVSLPYNALTITFVSYNTYQGGGFSLKYSPATESTKSIDIRTSNGGALKFPPTGNYSNNERLYWLVGSNQPNMGVRVTVHTKNIEFSPLCGFDSLSFYTTNARLMQKICGTSTGPEEFFFNFSPLLLVFTSDEDTVGSGFYLTYTFQKLPTTPMPPSTTSVQAKSSPRPTEANKCSSIYNPNPSSSGELLFPASGLYSFHTSCSWKIDTGVQYAGLALTFHWMDIDNVTKHCRGNSLTATTMNHEVLYEFCGKDDTVLNATFPLSSMYLVFTSTNKYQGAGFYLTYTAVSNPLPSALEISGSRGGALQFPLTGHYNSYAYHEWDIATNDTKKGIRLTMERKDIPTCSLASLKVYTKNGTFLQRFCGSSQTPKTFDFAHHALRLIFTNNGATPGDGFRLEYRFSKDAMNRHHSRIAMMAIASCVLLLTFSMVVAVVCKRRAARGNQRGTSNSLKHGAQAQRPTAFPDFQGFHATDDLPPPYVQLSKVPLE